MHGTYYNATIAAYVTLYLRLGKDEVGGSNPPSSSNIYRLNREIRAVFVLYFLLFNRKLIFRKTGFAIETHTKTHTSKGKRPVDEKQG